MTVLSGRKSDVSVPEGCNYGEEEDLRNKSPSLSNVIIVHVTVLFRFRISNDTEKFSKSSRRAFL